MKLKVKKAILAMLFILKRIAFIKRNNYLFLQEKEIRLLINRETNPNTKEGLNSIQNILNSIHTKEFRKMKLNHFKPIRHVKKRNRQTRQPKNS
jgi:hypothetical protein